MEPDSFEFHVEQFGGPAVFVAEVFGVDAAAAVFFGVIIDGDVLAAVEEFDFLFDGAGVGSDDVFDVWETGSEDSAWFEDLEDFFEEGDGLPVEEVFEEILAEDTFHGIGVVVFGQGLFSEDQGNVWVDGRIGVDVDVVEFVVGATAEVEFERFHRGHCGRDLFHVKLRFGSSRTATTWGAPPLIPPKGEGGTHVEQGGGRLEIRDL